MKPTAPSTTIFVFVPLLTTLVLHYTIQLIRQNIVRSRNVLEFRFNILLPGIIVRVVV